MGEGGAPWFWSKLSHSLARCVRKAVLSACINAQPGLRRDKWLNYLVIEYKRNTMGEKEKCSNTAASSRQIE